MTSVLTTAFSYPPSQAGLDRELNRFWGQHLRYHSSSINQAYYLGLYEYLGVGTDFDFGQIDALRKVTPEGVAVVAKKYLSDSNSFSVSLAGRGL